MFSFSFRIFATAFHGLSIVKSFLLSKNVNLRVHRLTSSQSSDFWIDKFHCHLESLNPALVMDNPGYMKVNDPLITMDHPFIELDIKSMTETILSSTVQPCTRLKEMFAIVTGMGRGKTRCLLEIERALRQCNRSVISVAITFDGFTADIPKPFLEVRDNYVLSIISRIISSYYEIPFKGEALELAENAMLDMLRGKNMNIIKPMEKLLMYEPKYRIHHFDHEIIIRSLIRYIVLEQRKLRPVERFVLLVDEVC